MWAMDIWHHTDEVACGAWEPKAPKQKIGSKMAPEQKNRLQNSPKPENRLQSVGTRFPGSRTFSGLTKLATNKIGL